MGIALLIRQWKSHFGLVFGDVYANVASKRVGLCAGNCSAAILCSGNRILDSARLGLLEGAGFVTRSCV